jgi:hypothetical protein
MLRATVRARIGLAPQASQETALLTAAQKIDVILKVQLAAAPVVAAAVAVTTPVTLMKEVHHLLSNAQKTAHYT